MKKFIISLLFIASVALAAAIPSLTKSEIETIEKIIDDRTAFTCYSNEEALAKAQKYLADVNAEAQKNGYSEQAMLIIDNMMATQIHSHMYEIDSKDKKIKEMLLPKIERDIKWIDDHKKDSGISAYIYYTTAEIISCGLSFMSLSEILSYGLKIYDFFAKAIELNPSLALAYSGLGQWYYHAPVISGGSTKKAYANFELAYQNATLKGEKFMANMYMSQMCFDQKKYDKAKEYLAAAEAIQPGTRLIKYVKKLNEAGYTYFYYTTNREKVEKKIGSM